MSKPAFPFRAPGQPIRVQIADGVEIVSHGVALPDRQLRAAPDDAAATSFSSGGNFNVVKLGSPGDGMSFLHDVLARVRQATARRQVIGPSSGPVAILHRTACGFHVIDVGRTCWTPETMRRIGDRRKPTAQRHAGRRRRQRSGPQSTW